MPNVKTEDLRLAVEKLTELEMSQRVGYIKCCEAFGASAAETIDAKAALRQTEALIVTFRSKIDT